MNRRKLTTIFSCVILTLLLTSPPHLRAQDLDNLNDLEAFLAGVFAVQKLEYTIPGMAVTVIKDGAIQLAEGYGWTDSTREIPMKPDFSHISTAASQLLIKTAVMQLVEQGRLNLYKDINDYLDFNIPTKTHHNKDVPPITLHHLLTHTSGFEETVAAFSLREEKVKKIPPLNEYLRTNLPERIFPPGAVASCSNYETALAAYIVELVSGQDFITYVEEHILKPLTMSSSTFDLSPSKGTATSKSSYTEAFLTTPEDIAKLLMAHLQLGTFQDTQILKPETARLMQKQQFTSHPDLPGMTYGFIEAETNDQKVLYHSDYRAPFHTALYLLPKHNIGIYVVYNSSEQHSAPDTFFTSFMEYFFPPAVKAEKPQPVSETLDYKGYFHTAQSNYTAYPSWQRLFNNLKLDLDQEGFLRLTSREGQTRYGQIGPGLFQELNGKQIFAITFQNGRAWALHFPGANSYIHTPWQQTAAFIGSLVLLSVLLMLLILTGWISQLLKGERNQHNFFVAKTVGTIYILLCLTTLIFFIDAVFLFQIQAGLTPVMFTAVEKMQGVIFLVKILGVASILLLIVLSYLWLKKRGTLWQRLYYTVLTLSAGSILWAFWQVNLF